MATQVLIFGLLAMGFNLLYGYTGPPVLRPRRLLRARRLRLRHRARQAARGRRSGSGSARGCCSPALGGARHRLLLPAPARHLLRDADPGLRPAALLHRLPPGRRDGRRRRPARHPAARAGPRRPGTTRIETHARLLLLRLRAGRAGGGWRSGASSTRPFGAVLQAIRENSSRAVACGYDVNRVKHLSFVFSACFAGLAGSLDALRLTVVPVESLYWTTSGQVVMMTLLGGAGTFFGPFVGRRHVPGAGGAAEPRPRVLAPRHRRDLLRVRPVPPQGDLGHAHRRHPWPSKCLSSTTTASASVPRPPR